MRSWVWTAPSRPHQPHESWCRSGQLDLQLPSASFTQPFPTIFRFVQIVCRCEGLQRVRQQALASSGHNLLTHSFRNGLLHNNAIGLKTSELGPTRLATQASTWVDAWHLRDFPDMKPNRGRKAAPSHTPIRRRTQKRSPACSLDQQTA